MYNHRIWLLIGLVSFSVFAAFGLYIILKKGLPTGQKHNIAILINNDLQSSSKLKKYFEELIASKRFPGTFLLLEYGKINNTSNSADCIPKISIKDSNSNSRVTFGAYIYDVFFKWTQKRTQKSLTGKCIKIDDNINDFYRLKDSTLYLQNKIPEFTKMEEAIESRDLFVFPEFLKTELGSAPEDYIKLIQDKFGKFEKKSASKAKLCREEPNKKQDCKNFHTYIGHFRRKALPKSEEEKEAFASAMVQALYVAKERISNDTTLKPIITSLATKRIFEEKPGSGCSMENRCWWSEFDSDNYWSNTKAQLEKIVMDIGDTRVKYNSKWIVVSFISTGSLFIILTLFAYSWKASQTEDIPDKKVIEYVLKILVFVYTFLIALIFYAILRKLHYGEVANKTLQENLILQLPFYLGFIYIMIPSFWLIIWPFQGLIRFFLKRNLLASEPFYRLTNFIKYSSGLLVLALFCFFSALPISGNGIHLLEIPEVGSWLIGLGIVALVLEIGMFIITYKK